MPAFGSCAAGRWVPEYFKPLFAHKTCQSAFGVKKNPWRKSSPGAATRISCCLGRQVSWTPGSHNRSVGNASPLSTKGAKTPFHTVSLFFVSCSTNRPVRPGPGGCHGIRARIQPLWSQCHILELASRRLLQSRPQIVMLIIDPKEHGQVQIGQGAVTIIEMVSGKE